MWESRFQVTRLHDKLKSFSRILIESLDQSILLKIGNVEILLVQYTEKENSCFQLLYKKNLTYFLFDFLLIINRKCAFHNIKVPTCI